MKILDNGHERHAGILRQILAERIAGESGDITFSLCTDEAIGPAESYRIEGEDKHWRVTGADERGLYYGIGKLLHTAKWERDRMTPDPPRGVRSPQCSFRAIYFAVHLNNWYANAPTEELERYIKELMLWGYNAIVLILPVIDLYSFEDEAARRMIEKSRAIFKLAKRFSMQTGLIICVNQGLRGADHALDADPSFDPAGNVRGNAGRNLCPAKPGAIDYLRKVWRGQLRPYADIGLDYLVTWPYDEGGCGCEKCRPWGANGYLDLCRLLRGEAVRLYPDIRMILSTWIFDKPDDQGEFDGLYRRLRGDMGFAEYIMADAHADYPRYPLEHEVIKPVVNFPEISMWKLYPWGGYGATPLPARYEGIWRSANAILKGGMPYSEGMYEDISKVQFVGYYWDAARDWQDILSEYLNYEVGGNAVADALTMISLIEKNHVLVAEEKDPDMAAARECGRLARKIDAELDARAARGWRWRLLYIRAICDEKRYLYCEEHGMRGPLAAYDVRHFASDLLEKDDEYKVLMRELRALYHSVPYNGRNCSTLPVVDEPAHLGDGRTYADLLRERAGNK